MVNIGGRSRGCSNCRRRRVKCGKLHVLQIPQQTKLTPFQDENRPTCRRCLRCGFECGGVKETSFIEAKILKSRRNEKWTTVPSCCDTTTNDCPDYETPTPLAVTLKWVDIHIYICYAKKYLLRGGPVDLALQELHLSDLISAGTSTESTQVFHRAVLSFAIIFFGSEHRQTSITKRGYSIYGIALKQLNQALSDPNCYTRDDIILSVVTLALLECFVPTGPKYYLKHMFGLERLLELRRPTANYSPKFAELYKGVRRMILFASLSTGRPSILSRPEWKSFPKTGFASEEMEEQHLFDMLADCTVLIAERDKALANWKSNLEKATLQLDKVKQKALVLLRDLYDWKKQWDSHSQNSHLETPAALLGLPLDSWKASSPPFRTIFEFANDSAATMLMFYDTASIYVLKVLSSLALEVPSIYFNQTFPRNPLRNSGYSDHLWKGTKDEYLAAERLAALEICRCIPYHLVRRLSLDSGSLTMAHLAMTTAWTTLGGNDSAEGRWMTDLLNTESRKVMAKGLWAN